MRILSFCITLLFSVATWAQCPTEDIVLSSQAEVDAFAATYPGCTELQEDLFISGDDIINLDGLSGITRLAARLIIQNNPLLPNLNGLVGITSFGDSQPFVQILNNEMLTSIEGLGGLEFSLDGSNEGMNITVSNNPSLSSLSGLEGFSGTVYTLAIGNNDALVNLQGLNSISYIDDVAIRDNDNLVTLSGTDSFLLTGTFIVSGNISLVRFGSFTNFQPQSVFILANPLLEDISGFAASIPEDIISTVSILDNERLSTCASSYLCQLIEAAESVEIANNEAGCNTKEEVEAACEEVLSVETSALDKTGDNVNIFPNPVRHMLQMEVSNIASFKGAVVQSLSGEIIKRCESATVNVSSLSAGVYFLSVTVGMEVVTKPFIKQ